MVVIREQLSGNLQLIISETSLLNRTIDTEFIFFKVSQWKLSKTLKLVQFKHTVLDYSFEISWAYTLLVLIVKLAKLESLCCFVNTEVT